MKSSPKTILYVSHSAGLYGAERSLLQLLTGLDRTRFRPVAVLPAKGPLAPQLELLGVEIEVVPTMRAWLSRRRGLSRLLHHVGTAPFICASMCQIMRLIGLYRVDIVHTNSLTVIDGALAAKMCRVPHVWHAREILEGNSPHNLLLGPRATADIISRLSTIVVAISQAVAQGFNPALAPLIVVYNGIDDRFFVARSGFRTDVRDSLGVNDDEFLVGTVANLTPEKGYEDLVRAAALAIEKVAGLKFVGLGGVSYPDYRCRIATLIEEYGMADRFRLLGFKENVDDYLKAFDLFVLPSRYEPFGRVVVEALAARVPVVATATGGIPEIIEDGISGWLVTPRLPEAIAAAIVRSINSPEVMATFREAGWERAKRLFNAERYVRDIERQYELLV